MKEYSCSVMAGDGITGKVVSVHRSCAVKEFSGFSEKMSNAGKPSTIKGILR